MATLPITSTALFPSLPMAIARMRSDRLMIAASGALPSGTVTDDYLSDKLLAAESEMRHMLRVPLEPTAFFPAEPTADEITALNGMPWEIDPGYDYDPETFRMNSRWGMLQLANKPLQSISKVSLFYPGGAKSFYDIPNDWIRMDGKYGTVQFVPSSSSFAAPLNAFFMQTLTSGMTVPLGIRIHYVAGIKDARIKYPEMVDAVMKMATIKIIEDAFLPQSGSISADGLSQSISNDMSKHYETIDRLVNGGKGSNGGLMAAIHGIRMMAMG